MKESGTRRQKKREAESQKEGGTKENERAIEVEREIMRGRGLP